ncbi:sugar phosphate isomerase/epimerase family protein [Paenibacillus sp. FSL W8-0194]|uniref:sugar phosphate isomerase/epimerase family protein n=1 Tax=Paenibacillus sp. FSL W8-0194 TaxID=2921711 RepID=UPI0030DA9737
MNRKPGDWNIGISFSLANPIDFNKMAESGIRCMELTWQPLDIFDPEVKRRCDEAVDAARGLGIEVWSLHIPFGTDWDPSSLDAATLEQVIAKVRRLFGYAADWGIRTLVFHPSWEPVPAEERAQRLQTAKQTLGLLSQEAAANGLRLAAECLPRTCLGHSASEMEFLTAGNPALGVCCDVNHLFKETPQRFIERLGDRIVTTHISDNDGTDEKHWMPGKGNLQWHDILRAFAEAGYQGPMVHEVRNPDPLDIAANWHEIINANSNL